VEKIAGQYSIPLLRLGEVTEDATLKIGSYIDLPLAGLRQAWEDGLKLN